MEAQRITNELTGRDAVYIVLDEDDAKCLAFELSLATNGPVTERFFETLNDA